MHDQTSIIIISLFAIVILLIIFYPSCNCKVAPIIEESSKVEGMASLNYGTFENTYPVGRCENKSLDRSDCEIGNCNLNSPITHDELCYIDCSQISDKPDRERCMVECKNLLKYC